MINLKEVAETLLQIVNNQEQLKSIVELMESSNNTVKDDISKLREGAKLEPQFDLVKMFDAVDQLCSSIGDVQDYWAQAESAIEETKGSIDDADYEANELRNMIEAVKHEVINEKDE